MTHLPAIEYAYRRYGGVLSAVREGADVVLQFGSRRDGQPIVRAEVFVRNAHPAGPNTTPAV